MVFQMSTDFKFALKTAYCQASDNFQMRHKNVLRRARSWKLATGQTGDLSLLVFLIVKKTNIRPTENRDKI